MTAAARVEDGRQLGEFDRQVLTHLTGMANLHLGGMLQRAEERDSLTAAAIDDLLDPENVEEITADMEIFWDFLIERADPYGPYVNFGVRRGSVRRSILSAAAAYGDLLKKLTARNTQNPLKEPIYGEFVANKGVQHGDVRPILSALGGGSPDAVVQLNGGPATGKIFTEWMSSNGIGVEEKIWIYGQENVRRTFNGHLQMDGLVFSDWNDDGLEIAPQDAWLRRTHYAPGDHWGCACVVAPYVPNFGPEFNLSFDD